MAWPEVDALSDLAEKLLAHRIDLTRPLFSAPRELDGEDGKSKKLLADTALDRRLGPLGFEPRTKGL